MGWGVCERALKLRLSRKDLTGKAKVKTGIGKSDLPGLQGGPRKRDFVLHDRVRAPRLYPDPDQSRADGSVVSLATHRATSGCRSVDNKVAGREESAPKSNVDARPTWLH